MCRGELLGVLIWLGEVVEGGGHGCSCKMCEEFVSKKAGCAKLSKSYPLKGPTLKKSMTLS